MASAVTHGDYAIAQSRERSRRHAVRVILLIYLIIIFDGFIRKYLLPDYRNELVFLRDPVVIYLYVISFATGFIRRTTSLWIVLGVVAAGLITALLQRFQGSESIIILVYGVRQYFLLCLLPFIIGEVFRHEDMQLFFKLNLFIIVFMAPLMVLQVYAPIESVMNVGSGGLQYEFGNLTYGEFVRAPGFFTSGLPLVVFLPVIGAIFVCIWMMPRADRPCGVLLSWGSLAALSTAIAVCGNRGAIVGLLLVAAAGIGMRLLMSSRGANRVVFWIAAALLFNGIFVTLFFPEQSEALISRWTEANEDEGSLAIIYRAVNTFGDFLKVIPDAPLIGFGIGTATNAFLILNAGSIVDWSLAFEQIENDWSRHVVELGPVFGTVFVGFRIFAVMYLVKLAIIYATKYAEPRPFMLAAAVVPTILYGAMTANTTMSGFGWFFAGLILAAPNYVRRFP